MARGTGVFNKKALRSYRLASGLSAAKLGAMVGTSKAMILAYESGKHVPEAERIRSLAQALDVPLARLVPWYKSADTWTLREVMEEIGISASELSSLLDMNASDLNRTRGRWLDDRLITIAMLRQRQGLTAAQTADHTGIGLSTYRRIEHDAMLPVRGRAGILERLAEVLDVRVPTLKFSVERHPNAVRRQYHVSQILARLMDRYCGQGSAPAVKQDDPDLAQLAALIRQPLGPLSRIVDYQLVKHQRLLKQKVRTALDVEYPEHFEDEFLTKSAVERVDSEISRAPYRSAAHISKFLCDGLTSRQWKSFTIVMARLALSERPESTGVSEYQEPELWEALRGRTHEGRPLLRDNFSISHEAPSGAGRFYFLTPAGFRYYEAARLTYAYLYPRIPSPRFPSRREQHWRRPV
ncbi:helix-turn-helix transcriptional regulator [Streptomyces sp. NPDC057411]|uniref:helix-turn-helix transcriptional regulator n=1 Tax=unclassified Streptomyces TaxID=2593676 RepID=UPI0036341EAD